jgi:flagellar basal body-associated protein FliL
MSRKILEKSNLGKENVKQNAEKYPWKRKGFLLFVWVTVVFVALLSYPFLRSRRISPLIPSSNLRISQVSPNVKRFRVQNDRSVRFTSFIIPFEEHGKFTYISLSISFELPNKELMDEMIKKNTQIRGIIYSILSKNINILKNISSLEQLKALITHRVNNVLDAGKVNEPIITDFSTV